MGKVTSSIEIEASPEKVFDFVISDRGNDIMMKDVAEGKWTSERPIGAGSTAYYVWVRVLQNYYGTRMSSLLSLLKMLLEGGHFCS